MITKTGFLLLLFAAAGCATPSTGTGTQACGDGALEQGEECDDGNPDGGDGCSGQCEVEPGWDCDGQKCKPVCGDGYTSGDELCDPGDDPYCTADCAMTVGACGDGVVQIPAESCDPGAGPVRGCSNACDPRFGFHCAPAVNTCAASGLPGDERAGDLTYEELLQYCAWMTGIVGGAGHQFTCGSIEYTVNSPSVCAAKTQGNWGSAVDCTVTELEDWVADQGSPCKLMSASPPVCEPKPTCVHSICDPGAKLDPGCDVCAKAVCDKDAYCCDTTWDNLCAAEAVAWCPSADCSSCDGKGACDGASGCFQCAVKGACAQEYAACSNSAACTGYNDCLVGCPTGGGAQACADACSAASPGGRDLYESLVYCAGCVQCPMDCNGPAQGCP